VCDRVSTLTTGGEMRRQRTHSTAQHAEAEACVWLGDLPLPWTLPQRRYRRLHALLYEHSPRGVPKVREPARATPPSPLLSPCYACGAASGHA